MYRRAGVPNGDDILSPAWRADSAASAIVEEMEAEGRETLRLMPGASELGAWLHAHGIPSALVTRNSSRTVSHFHSVVWPLPPLSPAISRDDPFPAKPDPTALTAISDTWGVPSAESQSMLMVGDSPSNDILFGQAAGVQTALLDTGRCLTEGGKTQGPDIVVNHLAQLAGKIWQAFALTSALTEPALHAKRDAPTPNSPAEIAAAAGDAAALAGMTAEAVSQVDATTGQTPLIWAAEAGSLSAVEVLLQRGVGLDVPGYLGATAVSRAARHGHCDVLAALLAHGADAGIPNNKLQYPVSSVISLACRHCRCCHCRCCCRAALLTLLTCHVCVVHAAALCCIQAQARGGPRALAARRIPSGAGSKRAHAS